MWNDPFNTVELRAAVHFGEIDQPIPWNIGDMPRNWLKFSSPRKSKMDIEEQKIRLYSSIIKLRSTYLKTIIQPSTCTLLNKTSLSHFIVYSQTIWFSGIPELGIPGCEPLILPEIAMNQGKGSVYVQSKYKDIKIYGPSQFVLRSVKLVNSNNKKFKENVSISTSAIA